MSICFMVAANVDQGGNYISYVGSGLKGNHELRMLDLSENFILMLQNLDDLDLRTLSLAQNKLSSLEGGGHADRKTQEQAETGYENQKDRAQAASLGFRMQSMKIFRILSFRHLPHRIKIAFEAPVLAFRCSPWVLCIRRHCWRMLQKEIRITKFTKNTTSSWHSLISPGVQRLSKLHCLDVRHNHITTIAALKAEEIEKGKIQCTNPKQRCFDLSFNISSFFKDWWNV